MNPTHKRLCSALEKTMVENFEADGHLNGCIMLIDRSFASEIIVIPDDRFEKGKLGDAIRDRARRGELQLVIVIVEAWYSTYPPNTDPTNIRPPSEEPNREEGIMLMGETDDGWTYWVSYAIKRDQNGDATLGERLIKVGRTDPSAAMGNLAGFFPVQSRVN